jgi:DNA-binding LacI/PurR family transcriptional regulator
MADVARLAGVSSQTVSRVSNGYAGVNEETRQQVLAAMQELGYRPAPRLSPPSLESAQLMCVRRLRARP